MSGTRRAFTVRGLSTATLILLAWLAGAPALARDGRLAHVQSAAFTPEGTVVTAWSDGRAVLFDADGAARLLGRVAPAPVESGYSPGGRPRDEVGLAPALNVFPNRVGLSGDGRRALLDGYAEMRVIEVSSGRALLTISATGAVDGALSADGRHVAALESGCEFRSEAACQTLTVWSVDDGRRVARVANVIEAEAPVLLSADRVIVSMSGNRITPDFEVRAWGLDGAAAWSMKLPDRGDVIVFAASPDRAHAFASADKPYILDVRDGRTVAVLGGPRPEAAVFSPDGAHLALLDDAGWSLWSVESGALVRREPVTSGSQILFLSSDRLAVRTSEGLRVWPLSSPESKILVPVDGEVLAAEGRRVLLKTEGGAAIRVFDPLTGEDRGCLLPELRLRDAVCRVQGLRDAYAARRDFNDIAASLSAADALLDALAGGALPAQRLWAAAPHSYAQVLEEVGRTLVRRRREAAARAFLMDRLSARDPLLRGAARSVLGRLLLSSGAVEPGLSALQAAAVELREGGAESKSPQTLGSTLAGMAAAKAARGDLDAGLAVLNEAFALSARFPGLGETDLLSLQADMLERAGRWPEAEPIRRRLALSDDDADSLDASLEYDGAERLREAGGTAAGKDEAARSALALGLNLAEQGRSAEAEPFLSRAVRRRLAEGAPSADAAAALAERARLRSRRAHRASAGLEDFRTASAMARAVGAGARSTADRLRHVHRWHVSAAWTAATGVASDSGAEAGTSAGHRARVTGLRFSPDGALLASTGSDDRVILWDVATGSERWESSVEEPGAAAFTSAPSLEGEPAAVRIARDGRPYLWLSVDDGGRLAASKNVYDLSWNDALAQASAIEFIHGRAVVLTDTGQTAHQDVSTLPATGAASSEGLAAFLHEGRVCLRRLGAGNGLRCGGAVPAPLDGLLLAVSPDGKTLAISGEDEVALATSRGKALRRLKGRTAKVQTAAFSPDGRRLATGGADGAVRVWDAETGRLLSRLAGHPEPVSATAWSPDGAVLATGDKGGEIHLWGAEGRLLTRLGTGGRESLSGGVRVLLSPDGAYLITEDAGGVRLWDAHTAEFISSLDPAPKPSGAKFSPDSRRVSLYAALLDVDTGASVPTPAGVELLASGGRYAVSRLLNDGTDELTVVGPDGRVLARFPYSGFGGRMSSDARALFLPQGDGYALGRVADGALVPLVVDADSVDDAAFSGDGTRLFLIAGGALTAYDATSGRALAAWKSSAAKRLQAASGRSPNVLGWSDESVLIWSGDGSTPAVVVRPASKVSAAALAPDGRSALVGLESGELLVIDASDGQVRRTIRAHAGAVHSVSFGGADLVATGSADGVAKLWRVGSDQPLRVVGK